LGWNETTNVTATDILDPYDYADDVVEGDLEKIKVNAGILNYTNYLVNGQPVDPDTIEEIDDQGDASTAAVVRSDVDSGFTSGMIALVPTASDAARLALDEDNGEPASELHLTLCFLGDAADYPQDQRDALVTSIDDMVTDSAIGSVQGIAFGVNYWNPTSDDPAWVLAVGESPDGGSLIEAKQYVYEAIYNTSLSIPDQHKPWVPHVTIAYGTEPILEEMEARLGPITFDRIRVAFGDEYHDVVLSDERATLTTS
jgi:2'-5' RNA ligase